MTRWQVRTRGGRLYTDADTALEACDRLKGFPLEDFGLVVTANNLEHDGDPEFDFVVATYSLFERWDDPATANRFREAMRETRHLLHEGGRDDHRD